MKLPRSASIVVLTGAGISAESGISTFRDRNGLWENHRIEDVASPEGFTADPMMVHKFYNLRRAQLFEVDPNPAHHALARLQREWPRPVTLVTQNVDDLHERGGSTEVIHMHGELRKVRCTFCNHVQQWMDLLDIHTPCPSCGGRSGMRPHIVWFGEETFELPRIEEALRTCGGFISIGTSGRVYPAAAFVDEVDAFAYTIELNMEPASNSSSFFEHRMGPASHTVPKLVEELLAGLE